MSKKFGEFVWFENHDNIVYLMLLENKEEIRLADISKVDDNEYELSILSCYFELHPTLKDAKFAAIKRFVYISNKLVDALNWHGIMERSDIDPYKVVGFNNYKLCKFCEEET